MADALNTDHSRSRAVLIGTWDYTHLPSVGAAVKNSFDRMKELLTSPACGWPSEWIEEIPNQREPGHLPVRLVELFDNIDDVALFYYVGHGQPDNQNRLCMGLVDSRKEAQLRAPTSLQFGAVWNALDNSLATTKIIILDCCFAGLAARDAATLGASVNVADMVDCDGMYTIAASGEFGLAKYEQGADGNPRPQTYFTKHLADVVEQGIAGQPEWLTFNLIFPQVKKRMQAASLPSPTQRNSNSAGDFTFARNVAFKLNSDMPTVSVSGEKKHLVDNYLDRLELLMGETGNTFHSLDLRAHAHGDNLSRVHTLTIFVTAVSRKELLPRDTVRSFVRACLCRAGSQSATPDEVLSSQLAECSCVHPDVDRWLTEYDKIIDATKTATQLQSKTPPRTDEANHLVTRVAHRVDEGPTGDPEKTANLTRWQQWRARRIAAGGTGINLSPDGYRELRRGNFLPSGAFALSITWGAEPTAAKLLATMVKRDLRNAAAMTARTTWLVENRVSRILNILAEDDPEAAEQLFYAIAESYPIKAVRLFGRAGISIPSLPLDS